MWYLSGIESEWLLFKWAIFSSEQVTFHFERWWWFLFCTIHWVNWIFIVLTHWNNSPQVDMSLNTFSRIWANQSVFFLFGLIWSWLEPTIYHAQGENANHYTTDAVLKWYKIVYNNWNCFTNRWWDKCTPVKLLF
jgi:hypothetical protein